MKVGWELNDDLVKKLRHRAIDMHCRVPDLVRCALITYLESLEKTEARNAQKETAKTSGSSVLGKIPEKRKRKR